MENDPTKPQGQKPAPVAPPASIHDWRDGFYSGPKGEAADTSEAAQPEPTAEPVHHWYTSLVDHLQQNALPRLGEMARVTPRALARAGNAVVQTAAEVGAAGMDALGVGGDEAQQDDRRKRAKGAKAVSEEELTLTYGPASDDTVANLYETVMQGASIALAASPLIGSGFVAGVAGGALAYDPYEHQLAEIAAEFGHKVPGIGGIIEEAGKLGSVTEQDNFLTARLKRIVPDAMIGATFEGLFWIGKSLLATKAGDVAAATVAREQLQAHVNGNGARPAEVAPVVVRPNGNGNGTWKIVENPADAPQFIGMKERPNTPIEAPGYYEDGGFMDQVGRDPSILDDPTQTGMFSENSTTAHYLLPNGDETTISYHINAEGELRIGFIGTTGGPNSLGSRQMRQLGRDLAKRTGAKKVSGYRISGAAPSREVSIDIPQGAKREFQDLTEEQIGKELDGLTAQNAVANDLKTSGVGAKLPDDAAYSEASVAKNLERGNQLRDELAIRRGEKEAPAVEPVDLNNGPAFTSRTEAELQAETINQSLNGRKKAQEPIPFTDAEVANHVEIGERISEAKSADDAQRLIDGTHFNFRFFGGSDRVKAQIEALSETIGKQIDGAQKNGGKNSHKAVAKVAERVAKGMGIRDWAERVAQMSAAGKNAHVELLMANAAVKQLGEEMASLSARLRLRPHDPALTTDARELLELWAPLTRDVAGMNSQAGRNLNILQARNTPEAEAIRFPKETPGAKETKAVSEATSEVKAAKDEVAKARKPKAPKEAKPKGSTEPVEDTFDQVPVSASDFSLARARATAERVRARLAKAGVEVPEFGSVQQPASSKRAIDVRDAADAQRADPLTEVAARGTRAPEANPVEELSHWLDNAEAEVDKVAKRVEENHQRRSLEGAKKNGKAFEGEQGAKETPVDILKKDAAEADRQSMQGHFFDSYTDEQIAAALRMFELGQGRVRNAEAIIEGLKVLDPTTGITGKTVEAATNVFINALISGAKTFETIVASGQSLLMFEYGVRALAGIPHALVSGNTKLMREGADMLYAHFAYAWDNVKASGAAFRENRSMIDPTPQMYATGGVVNSVVSLPGRTAGTLDEFTRITGYRAFVRAKASRMAREEGLTGAAFTKQVENDVKLSIDAKTGVGIMENALEFAGIPTLSNHPGTGTFSGDLSNFLAKYPGTKFIAPFIRPGVNTFRYVGKATPGINLFYKDMRAKLFNAEGGEEAAIAWTRSAVAGSMYTYAWFKCMDGTITGRGPSDPVLRSTWLKNHKPYSVKIGDEYHSYRRMEPFATFLGLAADAHVVQMELNDEEGTDADDVGKAVFASLLSNYVNKSYNQGLANFFGAIDDQDGSSSGNFLGGLVGGFIPQAVQQFNDDPIYREARTLVDELYKRTPGLSDKLPPKYNFLGEPIMKSGSMWNRNFSIMPELDARASKVEDALFQDGIKFSAPPDKEFGKVIDYKDPRWKKSEDDKLPYVRWMELVANGWDGQPGLRTQMEQMIDSDEWKSATNGAKSYPGGERGIMLAGLKSSVEDEAKQKMLDEYPRLREQWEGAAGMRGTARGEGQAGVEARRREFNMFSPK